MQDAGISQFSLVAGYWNSTGLTIPGAPVATGSRIENCILPVNESFLKTMQIPVVLGSGIEDRHITSPNVAVVNEEFAKKFFARRESRRATDRAG